MSFSEDPDGIHEIPRPAPEDKKHLYYDRQEIRQMRKEDSEEKQAETERKLKEAMAAASAMTGMPMFR